MAGASLATVGTLLASANRSPQPSRPFIGVAVPGSLVPFQF